MPIPSTRVAFNLKLNEALEDLRQQKVHCLFRCNRSDRCMS